MGDGAGVNVVGFDLEHVELGVSDGLESMAMIRAPVVMELNKRLLPGVDPWSRPQRA